MIRFIPITVAAAALAMPALAGTGFTAKLAQPNSSIENIIAAKALWSCNGEECVAELNRRKVTVRTCKKVASEVGELAAFSTEKDSLSEDDLAKCNEAAKK
ncbi:MAG: hypothetical protein WA989_10035 [Henriciella sp.]|uniref:CC_3452 family protein n=1 Tax=Henriciella sp. TaxID=1968823 RepID=UPI003C789C24